MMSPVLLVSIHTWDQSGITTVSVYTMLWPVHHIPLVVSTKYRDTCCQGPEKKNGVWLAGNSCSVCQSDVTSDGSPVMKPRLVAKNRFNYRVIVKLSDTSVIPLSLVMLNWQQSWHALQWTCIEDWSFNMQNRLKCVLKRVGKIH